jgi:hypothetical protein
LAGIVEHVVWNIVEMALSKWKDRIYGATKNVSRFFLLQRIPDHVSPKRFTTTKNITWTELEPPPLVIRNIMIGNHVADIFTPSGNHGGCSEVFAASVLSVEINNAVGLSRKKSRWAIISLAFDGRTEVTQLQWNPDTNTLEPKRIIDSMQWEISPVTSFDLAGLEIRLFEQHKLRRVPRSRLASGGHHDYAAWWFSRPTKYHAGHILAADNPLYPRSQG